MLLPLSSSSLALTICVSVLTAFSLSFATQTMPYDPNNSGGRKGICSPVDYLSTLRGIKMRLRVGAGEESDQFCPIHAWNWHLASCLHSTTQGKYVNACSFRFTHHCSLTLPGMHKAYFPISLPFPPLLPFFIWSLHLRWTILSQLPASTRIPLLCFILGLALKTFPDIIFS